MKISPHTEKTCFFLLLAALVLALSFLSPIFVVGIVLGMEFEEKLPYVFKWYDDLKRNRGW